MGGRQMTLQTDAACLMQSIMGFIFVTRHHGMMVNDPWVSWVTVEMSSFTSRIRPSSKSGTVEVGNAPVLVQSHGQRKHAAGHFSGSVWLIYDIIYVIYGLYLSISFHLYINWTVVELSAAAASRLWWWNFRPRAQNFFENLCPRTRRRWTSDLGDWKGSRWRNFGNRYLINVL